MDATIGLEGLAIECIIGARAHEREAPRQLLVDVAIEADIGGAAESDAIGDAIDYSAVARVVAATAREQACQLLERLAHLVVEQLFARFPAARVITLTVRKPGAVRAAACAFVRVRRARPQVAGLERPLRSESP